MFQAVAMAASTGASDPSRGGGGTIRLQLDQRLGIPTAPDIRMRMAAWARRKYERFYLPWTQDLRDDPVTRPGRNGARVIHDDALAMTIALVVDNRPASVMEATFGLTPRKRIAQQVIRAALQRYVEIAGLEGGAKRRV